MRVKHMVPSRFDNSALLKFVLGKILDIEIHNLSKMQVKCHEEMIQNDSK
jgi:hypothetical protein